MGFIDWLRSNSSRRVDDHALSGGGRLRLLGIDAMEPRVQSGIPTGKGLHLELKNPGGITTVM